MGTGNRVKNRTRVRKLLCSFRSVKGASMKDRISSWTLSRVIPSRKPRPDISDFSITDEGVSSTDFDCSWLLSLLASLDFLSRGIS